MKSSKEARSGGPSAGDMTLIEQHLQMGRLLEVLVEREAKRLKLTLTQARVIACVARLTDGALLAHQALVAKATGYSDSHVSDAVAGLVELELLTQKHATEGDLRQTHLQLTESGRKRHLALRRAMLPVEIAISQEMRITLGKPSQKVASMTAKLNRFIAE